MMVSNSEYLNSYISNINKNIYVEIKKLYLLFYSEAIEISSYYYILHTTHTFVSYSYIEQGPACIEYIMYNLFKLIIHEY